ncbi:phosphotransferase [Gordonia jinghuaiqii]|uniref:Phosphotransferase n=1 Tax=Gordonia jinghuaiqii TaxID=2758710 RepID=A0A7D7LVB5_9ACTN|nr:phosphotransferase [Gordonia jinghuaiqii]MCR5979414.1 phosphotransferase [Gordonia jinghuaiqii]MCR5979835.1 phosphotransferase [Gordonia jinghuaiqii]QMT00779.1 phosphotransferase [Gordonia jinghuaiqii]
MTAIPSGGTIGIPTSAEQLTPAWLSAFLAENGHDATVESVVAQAVGTGQMAGSYRLTLEYAEPTDLPPTLVAKLATGAPEQREFGSGVFRNEVRFYRELADGFTVPIPRCYAATISAASTEFVLLLEDMGAAVQGDQIAGCSPAQAESVAVAAAGLHAPRWNDQTLLDAMPLPGDAEREMLESILEPMAAVYRERFSPDARSSAAIDWLVREGGAWLVAPLQNTGLIHGDLRVDNILFGPSGEVTVIDWQTITTGNPLRDISFLLSTSLTTEDRRRHERGIVASYHRALVTEGVADYTLDQCWDDYVGNLIQAPMIIVFGSAAAQPTERGNAMFDAMLSRSAAAIDDLAPGGLTP